MHGAAAPNVHVPDLGRYISGGVLGGGSGRVPYGVGMEAKSPSSGSGSARSDVTPVMLSARSTRSDEGSVCLADPEASSRLRRPRPRPLVEYVSPMDASMRREHEERGDPDVRRAVQRVSDVLRKRKSTLRTLRARARLAGDQATLYSVQIGDASEDSLQRRAEAAEKAAASALAYRGKCVTHLNRIETYSQSRSESERQLRKDLLAIEAELGVKEHATQLARKRAAELRTRVAGAETQLKATRDENISHIAVLRRQVSSSSGGTCEDALSESESTYLRTQLPTVWQRVKRATPGADVNPRIVYDRVLHVLTLKTAQELDAETAALVDQVDEAEKEVARLAAELSRLKANDRKELRSQSDAKAEQVRAAVADSKTAKLKYASLTQKMTEVREAIVGLAECIGEGLGRPELTPSELASPKVATAAGARADSDAAFYEALPGSCDVLMRAARELVAKAERDRTMPAPAF